MSWFQNSFQPLPQPKNRVAKFKNDPKIKSESNLRIEGKIENESCSATWVDPKKVVQPQTSPLGPQKDKNDPKTKSNSNVRIQLIIENESFSTIWVYPKTVVETYHNHKNSPLGPQKVNNNLKIK